MINWRYGHLIILMFLDRHFSQYYILDWFTNYFPEGEVYFCNVDKL